MGLAGLAIFPGAGRMEGQLVGFQAMLFAGLFLSFVGCIFSPAFFFWGGGVEGFLAFSFWALAFGIYILDRALL